MMELTTTLGPVTLRTPLIAASGTVGSIIDFTSTVDFSVYGAAVAKSVAPEPWEGRPPPRLAPVGTGMLNGIGIQNPGIETWAREIGPDLEAVPTQCWGSAVAHDPDGFGVVAAGLQTCGTSAVEINLSCPNLGGKGLFALDAGDTARVVGVVRSVVDVPIGAKLSPNAPDVVAIAEAAVGAGADWLVLTNTVWGAGIDIETRKPLLSGGVGGYSGIPVKPIALRCVWEVAQALPDVPIVGCGGVATGEDVVEYLLAGASAVALGSVHFAEPRAGRRILRELVRTMERAGVGAARELVRAAEPW
jgi:dihydroorotate dehydrogenase (NAD+) catalytic subunit